jgi:hypothetical protein
MHSGRGGLNDGGSRRREGSTGDGDGERVGARGRGCAYIRKRKERETTGWTRSISPRAHLALEALSAVSDRFK